MNRFSIYKKILGLKQYIAFNLLSLLGWCDSIVLVLFFDIAWYLNKNQIYGMGLSLSIYLFFYMFGRLIVLGILFLVFLIEKILKKKIKDEFILQNRAYNIFWLFGIVSFFVCTIVVLIIVYSIFH